MLSAGWPISTPHAKYRSYGVLKQVQDDIRTYFRHLSLRGTKQSLNYAS